MAKYNNQYSMNVKAATPNLRGLDTNYDNTGKKNLGGIGLGDLFQLDYDRNKIEQIFNQGTDAQYALMQKENQIAQNNFVNNQFQNQQSMIEGLRQQRNDQISSGMAKGLAAAAEQGTILGLQQDNSQAALDLANQQQTEADKIAAEYAQNVVDALEEANAVKQAIAGISAQLYEADMLGYTGELSYLGQMDANASNRYGSELGLEGTKYSANKNLEGVKYQANKNLEGTKYAANQSAAAQRYAAQQSAAAQKAAAQISASANKGGGSTTTASTMTAMQYAVEEGKRRGLKSNELVNYAKSILMSDPNYKGVDEGKLWNEIDYYVVNTYPDLKNQTKADWEKAQEKAKANTTTTAKAPNKKINTASSLLGAGYLNNLMLTSLPSAIIKMFKK